MFMQQCAMCGVRNNRKRVSERVIMDPKKVYVRMKVHLCEDCMLQVDSELPYTYVVFLDKPLIEGQALECRGDTIVPVEPKSADEAIEELAEIMADEIVEEVIPDAEEECSENADSAPPKNVPTPPEKEETAGVDSPPSDTKETPPATS